MSIPAFIRKIYYKFNPFQQDEMLGFFNGSFVEPFDAVVSSTDGIIITMTLEKKGGGDLTMIFSDGQTALDCTPAQTIELTAGSIASPQENYIYIPQSTKVLTKSLTGFPTDSEHIKIGFFYCQTAAYIQADGCLINQNINNEKYDQNGQGHLSHMGDRSRRMGAIWISGIDGAGTDDYTTSTAGSVTVQMSAGVVMQAHRHIVPAKDTSGTDDIHVLNAHSTDGGSFFQTQNLYDITVDSAGVSLANRFFNIFLWGVANKSGQYSPVMCNIPSGSYAVLANAQNDTNNYNNTIIPEEFSIKSSTGFPICLMTFRSIGGTWEYHGTVDLRNSTLSGVSGGAVVSKTEFSDNVFKVFNNADVSKISILDLSGITTGNTRTITIPDKNITLAGLSDLPTTTTDISEGTRLYFTESRVLSTVLTGLTTVTAAIISASDSIKTAFEKIQAQITAFKTSKIETTLTTTQLELLYSAAVKCGFTVSSAGFLTVDPSGGRVYNTAQYFFLQDTVDANLDLTVKNASDGTGAYCRFLLDVGTSATGKASLILYGGNHATSPDIFKIRTETATANGIAIEAATGKVDFNIGTNNNIFHITSAGIFLDVYPTTNPNVAGQVYADQADGYALKVSQG